MLPSSKRNRWLWLLTMPMLLVLFAFTGTPASGQAPASREISNCPSGPARLWVHGPAPGEIVRTTVRLVLRADCRGGVPVSVGIDGVGYNLRLRVPGASPGKRRTLIPHPDYNPSCPKNCWPQFALGSYDIEVGPGNHVLEIRAGIQGTDLPSFEPIRFSLTSSPGGELPDTGVRGARLVATGGILVALGLLAEWLSRRRPDLGQTLKRTGPDSGG
jgi:hypothetical protein